MHLAIGSVKSVPKKNRPSSSTFSVRSDACIYAVDEIYAYIAIRDELLAEAEELRTRTKLDTVIVANDFVAGCLRPSRKPYQMQCLPEADALRERHRCAGVTSRIAELRASAT